MNEIIKRNITLTVPESLLPNKLVPGSLVLERFQPPMCQDPEMIPIQQLPV